MADLTNDHDIETDFCEPSNRIGADPIDRGWDSSKISPAKGFCEVTSVYKSKTMCRSKDTVHDFSESKQKKDDSQVDSGMLSMVSEFSLGLSLEPEEKMPVQCSDASAEEDEVVRKMTSLSTRDEGFGDEESIGIEHSFASESGSLLCSAPEPEADDIEIDLYHRDEDGDTILHVAIYGLYQALCLTLVDLVDEIDCLHIQNNLLQSPLHLAVLTRQVDIVKALVNRGVDVTLRDQQGNTPLHIACRNGDKDAVSLLVQSFGKDQQRRVKYFSVKNCEGLTCLHIASQLKHFDILGHLFAKGADVNIGDAKSGRTMLHYAVEKRDLETVSLLLTHPGIDVDCKTFKGETPIVVAFWRNYQEIVKKLKSKGAFFSYDLVEESDEEATS